MGFRSFLYPDPTQLSFFPAQIALSFHPRNLSPTSLTIKTLNEYVLSEKPTEEKDHMKNI